MPNSLPKDHGVCLLPSSAAPPIHPCRLTEFEIESFEHRVVLQIVTGMNRNMNSPFVLSEQESCRRPDPRTILLLTQKILDEVEQALVTSLTTGKISKMVNGSVCYSFKAVSFKKSEMEKSRLGVPIIEAALTHIIEHLDEHPKLVVALGTTKIGYHDKGMSLEDIGVRMFVVKLFAADNKT
jgi:hypothetical protein